MTVTTCEDEVVFETDLDASPEKVWRALTVPEFVARWLAPNDIRAREGHFFRLEGERGDVDCRIVEADEPKRLSYSWREEHGPESLVSFRLARTGTGGTRLTIVHGGLARPALPRLSVAGVSGCRMSLASGRPANAMLAANVPAPALAA